MANPRGKAYVDESKFHCQYDWEENIKGKYESFFNNGGKKFRHKYLVNRFMTLGKDHENSKRKSSMEININGTIEKYYENGKKQSLVTYTDYYSVGKKVEDKERIVLKSDRKGLKKKFYESGKLFCSGEFGMKGFEGGVEYYSLKGAIIKVENYKAGVLHGKINEFFPDGTQKLKGNYKNGKKIGKWQTFDSSGKPISSIKY